MKTRLLSFVSVLLLLPAVAGAQLWSDVVDSKRAMDWTQAGLPGSNLPSANWPICATVSPYTGDSTAIQNALAACHKAQPNGGVVALGTGTFHISNGIPIPQDNLALRGQGAGSTTIHFTTLTDCGGGFICMKGGSDGSFPQQGGSPHWAAVRSGQNKGSTQLILSSLNTAVVGSILVLNQCDTGFTGTGLGAPCTGTRAQDNGGYFHCQDPWRSAGVGCAVAVEGGVNSWRSNSSEMEAVAIVAINQGGCGSTCVSLSKPIEQPDWGGDTQAVIIQPRNKTGVENMTLVQDVGGDVNRVGVTLFNTYHCWVSGVSTINMGRLGVHLYDSYGGLVKDSYFFGNPTNYGDHAAIRAVGGSNNLIQNNIAHATRSLYFGADAMPEHGDVVAYNFATNNYNGSNANAGASAFFHGAGSSFALIEGNTMFGWSSDGDHGATGSLTTIFRNFLWGWYSCANGGCGSGGHASAGIDQTPIRLFYGSRYHNIIGNVLGTPGFNHDDYQSSDVFANAAIYIWGAGQSVGGYKQPQDSLVGTTTMLWGNWDTFNNAARFQSSEVPTSAPSYPNPVPASETLPASFYLTSKPNWFGSLPWPAIGPDVTGGNIGQCTGTFDVAGQFNGTAARSSSQCVGSSLNASAWDGHVNTNAAMKCYFDLGGLPDGTGPALSFNAGKCYGTSSSSSTGPAPAPPEHLVITIN